MTALELLLPELGAMFGPDASSSFGAALACAGDVNADGRQDLIVGAPAYSTSTGRAYICYGSSTGLFPPSGWIVTGTTEFDGLGSAVSSSLTMV